MLQAYVAWVVAHPFLSAALQFALLGTLGEVVAASARHRRLATPCSWPRLAAKALAWALLGEPVTWNAVAGAALTLLGVSLVLR